jgi:hypothetical protein
VHAAQGKTHSFFPGSTTSSINKKMTVLQIFSADPEAAFGGRRQLLRRKSLSFLRQLPDRRITHPLRNLNRGMNQIVFYLRTFVNKKTTLLAGELAFSPRKRV